MKRVISIFLSPELFWAAVYIAMHVLAQRNIPPTEAGSQALEKWWLLLPIIVVPFTYALLVAPGNRWWMLLRINVAGFIGLCLAAYRVTSAIDYQDTRNSGVPMGLVLSVCFALFAFAVLDVVALSILLWLNRKKKQVHAIPPPLV